MGKKSRVTTIEDTKSDDGVYVVGSMGSFETIFMDDANKASCSEQPTRNQPNILRNSNAKVYKNTGKTLLLDGSDISVVSIAEDAVSLLDCSTSSSVDSIKNDKTIDSKIESSPKSHHQRKQVHHPLDTWQDMPDWNNNSDYKADVLRTANKLETLYVSLSNEKAAATRKMKLKDGKRRLNLLKKPSNKKRKNTHVSQTADKLETAHVSPSHEEAAPTKRTKPNGGRKRLNARKKSGAAARKSDNKKTAKPSRNTKPAIVTSTDTNTENAAAVQSDTIDNRPSDNVANVDSSALFHTFCRNNNIYNIEENNTCYSDHNAFTLDKPTDCSAMSQDAPRKDPLSYEFLAGENNSAEDTTKQINRSNFLFASEVLNTCSYANCTSCDKDLVTCNDLVSCNDFMSCNDFVPSCANSDAESEFFASCAYDIYTSDFYNIFDDIDPVDRESPFSEECTSGTSESAYSGNKDDNCDAAALIDNGAPSPLPTPVKQCESKDPPSVPDIVVTQDLGEGSPSTKLVVDFDESTVLPKPTELMKDLDEMDFNQTGVLAEENDAIRFDLNQAAVSSNAREDRPCKRTKDDYVIQCAQCSKLFNQNKFRRHFTHCTFYKENFRCHVCDKMYRHKSSLVHHMRATHHLVRNNYEDFFECHKCDKLYVRFRAFQRHLLVHDDREVLDAIGHKATICYT